MSTEFTHDPDTPIAVTEGVFVVARFTYRGIAEEFKERLGHEYMEIIDTTPKPRIPNDAEFITWVGENWL